MGATGTSFTHRSVLLLLGAAGGAALPITRGGAACSSAHMQHVGGPPSSNPLSSPLHQARPSLAARLTGCALRGGRRDDLWAPFPAATVAMSAFLWGYETGIITGALLAIVPAFGLESQPAQQGLVATTATIGSLCGTMAAGRMADLIGRTRALAVAALCSLLGASAAASATRIAAIVNARLLSGFAIGVLATVIPMYAAECAPAASRGAILAIPQLGMSTGIAAAYLRSAWVLRRGIRFRPMFSSVMAPAALCAVLSLTSPESPRWLLRRAHGCGAARSLAALRRRSEEEVACELKAIEVGLEHEGMYAAGRGRTGGEGRVGGGLVSLVRDYSQRRTLLVCLALQVLQLLGGISLFLSLAHARAFSVSR